MSYPFLLNSRAITVGVLLSLSALQACSNAGKSDASPAATPTLAGIVRDGDLQRPGRIVITPEDNISDLKGYLVGDPSHPALTHISDQPGKLGFANVQGGTYDIVLNGMVANSDGSKRPVALRVSGVKVVQGSDTPVRSIELKSPIHLSGRIDGNLAGVEISIPGTLYKTLTNESGRYLLSDIAEGHHDISCTSSGSAPSFIGAQDYRETATLPTLAMIPEGLKLDAGIHYLGGPVATDTAHAIILRLVAPMGMTHFRYGWGGGALNDQPWIVLRSSLEIEIPAGDRLPISVQYSVDQRQLSPIFNVSVPAEI